MKGAGSAWIRLAASGLLCVAGAAAQSTSASPEFEAAVIKPAAPPVLGRMMVRMAGGPGHGDPAQLNYVNVSLKMVMATAYGVKNYQISGPDWLNTERFDITAKIAPGTTEPEFRLMLQNLLAERFQLKVHHETKDLPMMSLVVAKNGPKMTESKPDSAGSDVPVKGMGDGGPNAPPPPPPPPPDGGGGARMRIGAGPDGMPKMPPGQKGNFMMIGAGGRMRLQSASQTMAGLCEMLSNQLGTPVEDHTGLTAKYDFTLDFVPDMSRMTGPGGMPMPMMMQSHDGGGGGGEPAAGASEPSGPTLEQAVQEQLGLKLERSKGAADFVVVDHMEKTPTEN